MNAPPRNTAFYDRKRRLAYYFAWASMAFLTLELSLGFLLEFTSRPHAARTADGFRVIHRAFSQDELDGSRLQALDPEARPLAPSFSFPDTATALLPEGRDLTVFFGSQAARLADGKIDRNADLHQKWEVLAAVDGPAGPWIFGWADDQILARRRDNDVWGPEIVVAKSAAVDQLVASRDGAAGPLVAWRERGTGGVKTALHDGSVFVPGSTFEIGPVEHWSLVLSAGRQLLVYYNRDDRSYRYLTLRVECCPGCPTPIPLHKVRFAEPALLLGRKLTGLAAVVSGDRLTLFLTRISTLMTASMPLATLEPDSSSARLVSISSQASWRHVVAAFIPVLLVFCSFSMIFLGFVLFRERGRLARGIPVPGPQSAEFLQRAMAVTLDQLLLFPFLLIAVELMNIAPDSDLVDLADPGLLQALALGFLVHFLYYFLMEWRFGWTIGKRIIGLRVAQLDGSRLTLKGALVRNVIRLFDVEAMPLAGSASLLMTKRRQRLGDLAAGSIVVLDLPD